MKDGDILIAKILMGKMILAGTVETSYHFTYWIAYRWINRN